jgi:hypothetical protein
LTIEGDRERGLTLTIEGNKERDLHPATLALPKAFLDRVSNEKPNNALDFDASGLQNHATVVLLQRKTPTT